MKKNSKFVSLLVMQYCHNFKLINTTCHTHTSTARCKLLKSWFGLGGTVLKWFTSYLSDCCQTVKIGSTLSELSKLITVFPKVLSCVHCCFHVILHHLAKSSFFICILNSISVWTILSYTSIPPIRMPLLLLPS